MPSFLVGAQSGGVQLTSGNPFSGAIPQPSSVFLRVSKVVSGLVYLGYSGGLTITSGTVFSSGGLLDGIEMANGDERSVALPPGGLECLYFTTVAGISGTVRIFWDRYPKQN